MKIRENVLILMQLTPPPPGAANLIRHCIGEVFSPQTNGKSLLTIILLSKSQQCFITLRDLGWSHLHSIVIGSFHFWLKI